MKCGHARLKKRVVGRNVRPSSDGPATRASGTQFRLFWSGGHVEKDVYFQLPSGIEPCELRYFAGRGQIRFLFQ